MLNMVLPNSHDSASNVPHEQCVGGSGNSGSSSRSSVKSSSEDQHSTLSRTTSDQRHARQSWVDRSDAKKSPADQIRLRAWRNGDGSSSGNQKKFSGKHHDKHGFRKSPSEMDAHRRRDMAKIVPTTELTKSELIALVLAARSSDIGEEMKNMKIEVECAKRKVTAETVDVGFPMAATQGVESNIDLAEVAALRQENLSLKKQVKELEGKLEHECAVSRQLCVEVSRMKTEGKHKVNIMNNRAEFAHAVEQ